MKAIRVYDISFAHIPLPILDANGSSHRKVD